MKITREEDIDRLLQARSEIDEELRRHKTHQTVLFTDIVGSTTYFDRFGDTEGLLLLYRHAALVSEAVQDFKGTVVKTIGDSVMAEFSEPLHAVHAAIEIQRLLLYHNQSLARSERVQIRIGIHSGLGFRHANDLFGDIVNVAARITKRSGPAQILVSQSAKEMIPSPEIAIRSLGPVTLEGKYDTEELFEVLWMEAGEYAAFHSGLSGTSIKSEPPTPTNTSRAFHSIHLLVGRVVNSLDAKRGLAALKALAVLAVYLTIAAGMLSGRADTRLPAVRIASAPILHFNETPRIAAVEKTDIQPSQQLAALSIPEPASTASDQPVTAPSAASPTKIEPISVNRRPAWMTLIETVQIPAGSFMMGNDSGRKDEKPRHPVKLDGFNLSRTEITNRQYLAFLTEASYPRPRDPDFAKNYLTDYPSFPVINVSYDDALAFCAWAGNRFNASVRLPTEAEWEYAAVAGRNGELFPWGMQDPLSMARFRGNAPFGIRTAASNAFPPNGFGLYNMSGNVWEWVRDYYSRDYYTTSPIRNPQGPPSGVKHSVRGGSWAGDDSTLQVTRRSSRSSGERSDQVGFRVVIIPVKTQRM